LRLYFSFPLNIMPRHIALIILWSFLLAVAGCGAMSTKDSRPIAEDPVCVYNGDLGCSRVRVDERTPRALYKGKPYYFCTEECRDAFMKDPAKYVGKSSGD